MGDNPRIEDLRRRVQLDPASIAFAQLAEEYRRARQAQESIETCRAGLTRHPGHLSARVTLGRALLELGQLDEAQHELETVLESAAENLAAIRGLGDIHLARGSLQDALTYYEAALDQARNDPDLNESVADLTRRLAPAIRAGDLPPVAPAEPVSTHLPVPGGLGALAVLESASILSHSEPTVLRRSNERADQTIAALEQWLTAIHVTRTLQGS